MDKNILYQNLDMLSVMEACKDKSKDFILLFMPPNMGGTVGKSALRPFVNEEQSEGFKYENEMRYMDYGELRFYDREQLGNYIKMVQRVIQNASRILTAKGVFCFGFPKYSELMMCSEAEKPQIKLLLQQAFENCSVIDVPNFSVSAEPQMPDVRTNKYDLYMCSNGNWFSDGYNEIYNLKLPPENPVGKFWNRHKDVLNISAPMEKGWFRSEYLTVIRLLNMVVIPELRSREYVELALDIGCKVPQSQAETDEALDKYKQEEKQIQKELAEIVGDNGNFVPLAESLMRTYCKKGSRTLFPYDRNGQYAAIADKLGLEWVSLYKWSLPLDAARLYGRNIERYRDEKRAAKIVNQIYGENCIDYLEKVDSSHYVNREIVPEHKPVQYDNNYLASAKDANALKNRFSKITSDIIECAAASGLENSGSMEDAIHAVVSLAVKGQKGNITGDEAKNWYGDGWELLSEQCQDYLQTAAAFEKLSELSETADYAPIVIEYCRAVELETNNVVIKPYMQSLKDKNYQENDFYKNKAADYFKDVIARFSDDSKPSSMMLGEIGTSLSYASSSYSDRDIFSTLQQYCIKCGRLHLLDSVTVGKYRLIGKIRNQSAHPSSLDKGCVNQARQLVRDALKAQQKTDSNRPVEIKPLVCAIIGPDANKMNIASNTALFRAAIRNQIDILNMSRIQAFTSSGNAGFDLIVAECLLNYKLEDEDHNKVALTEYLPSQRYTMKTPPKVRPRILKVDKNAVVVIAGDADNATNREICQRKALENAQFCIAYFKPGGGSKIEEMLNEAIRECGLIVWNAYGIE